MAELLAGHRLLGPVARRRDAAVAGALLLGAVIALLAGDRNPSAVLIVVGVLSYLSGACAPSAVGAWAVAALLVSLEVSLGIPEGAWVPIVLVTLGPWLVGRALRSRRALVAALARRTQELVAEQDEFARLAVQQERARIARELHDVVAHNLAVMVLQAGAGRMASPDQVGRSAERFASIRDVGRQALAELAQLTGVLHEEVRADDPRERLRVMLAQARAAGLNVRATPLAPEVELPRELAETAHRVVQEGLTNVLKHAPGADVHVALAVRHDVLEVEVHDSGGQASPGLAETGAGLGLAGLHERVTAIGGHLEAALAPDEGWQLRAQLPLGGGLASAG